MTVFNGSLHLRQAIESILNQTHKNFEFIINDDKSTDDSYSICKSYALDDSRIKLYQNEQNLGLVKNFNKSFNYASKEFYMWADQDDYWAPDFISSCLQGFTTSDVGLVATQTASISAETGFENFVDVGFNAIQASSVERMIQYRRELYSGRHIGGPFCGVYRLEALKQSMPMIPKIAGDQIILFNLISKWKLKTIAKKLCFKRFGGSSSDLVKLARVVGLTSKSEVNYYPYLKREVEFQKTIYRAKDNISKKMYCSMYFALHFLYKEYVFIPTYNFLITMRKKLYS